MSLRQLTKEAKKGLSKALFYFPQEMKTGIAPTRLILNSDKIIPLKEGTSVTVNWGGKKVQAEILALDGKQSFFASILILCSITWKVSRVIPTLCTSGCT